MYKLIDAVVEARHNRDDKDVMLRWGMANKFRQLKGNRLIWTEREMGEQIAQLCVLCTYNGILNILALTDFFS